MIEFDFFLEAWTYCYHHNLPASSIRRAGWKTWCVEIEDREEVYG